MIIKETISFINTMHLNRRAFQEPEVVAHTYLYCQFIYVLIHKPVQIFGSLVREWFVPCYHYDLDPTKYESVVKLLDHQVDIYFPEEIDVWIPEVEDQSFKQKCKELQTSLSNLGYDITNVKTSFADNIRLRCVRLQSRFASNIRFGLKIYGANSFLNVDFDVNNLYVACNPQKGIETIDFLSSVSIPFSDGFGYLRERNRIMKRTISNIIRKECFMLDFDPLYEVNKQQLYRNIERILLRGYSILNHVAIKPKVSNALGITTCSVCLEDFCPVHKLVEIQCSHVFHVGCIMNWWKTHLIPCCPNCRTVV